MTLEQTSSFDDLSCSYIIKKRDEGEKQLDLRTMKMEMSDAKEELEDDILYQVRAKNAQIHPELIESHKRPEEGIPLHFEVITYGKVQKNCHPQHRAKMTPKRYQKRGRGCQKRNQNETPGLQNRLKKR